MDKLINVVIKIQEIIKKSGQYGQIAKIKGDDNHTYTVYEQKKDGSTSVAWELMDSLGIGDSVQVAYAEKEGEYEGKKYISRIVRNFDFDIGNGVQNAQMNNQPSPAQTTPSVANNASQSESRDEFSRRLGIQGHINALLSNPNYYNPDNSPTIALLVKEAIAVEDEAEKQLNPSSFRQAVQAKAPHIVDDELPVIQQGEGLSPEEVEDIPF